MSTFFETFFQSGIFMPHGHCYFWKTPILLMHTVSDVFIGLSYLAISSTLAYLVFKAKDIPFQWMYLAFGIFIVTCGFTHFVAVINTWNGLYWLEGAVKVITAIASVGTALLLPPLVPKALALASAARVAHDRGIELEKANKELGTLYDKAREVDELKTNFFANVSHELRTPLTLILGPIEKTLSDPSLSEVAKRELLGIQQNAQTLLKHVNDLLDIAKLEAKKLTPTPAKTDLAQLSRFTSSHFESLAQTKGLQFETQIPETLGAEVDPDMIERVLMNLISNAFKFVPKGGKVRLTVRKKEKGASIAVEDNGPGVPDELREAIFERFRQADESTTRKFGGTGLGLAIAKEFVELHKGSISVCKSTLGGACFEVTLPVAWTGAENTEVRFEQTARSNVTATPFIDPQEQLLEIPPFVSEKRGHILLVEDNTELAKFVVDSLVEFYNVTHAENGQIGFEKAKQLKPDLILSDIMMPVLSGEDMLKQIRQTKELDLVPVVMLTAKADESLRVRLLEEGAQDYIFKPFSVKELMVRVRSQIQLKKAREILQGELESRNADIEGLARSLTSLKRELETSNRIKDEFLATVSHELRTPLNAILGWVEIFKGEQPDQETFGTGLEVMERNTENLIRLVEDLLDISNIISGRLQVDSREINLADVLTVAINSMRPAADAKGVSIKTSFDQKALTVLGDSARLQQVIWNLLSNSVRHTPAGGIVSVELKETEHSAVIKVRDTGEGMDPAFVPFAFDRFRQEDGSRTRRYGGLGLGLSIAKYLIELHGGTISAASEGKNKGATFKVTLPFKDSNGQSKKKISSKDPEAKELSNLRILVVDDGRDTRELLNRILTRQRAIVLSAETVAEALQILQKEKVDIVLSDIGLPDEDGISFVRKIRNSSDPALKTISAIGFSGFSREEDKQRALDAGFNAYLSKPLKPAEIVVAIKKHLRTGPHHCSS